MTTLKPCPNPWCVRNEVRFRLSDAGYRLRCRCGIRGPLAETAVSAESAWNHRPGEEAVAEECARIADELAEAPDIELNTIGLGTSDFALYHIRLYARSIARKIRSRFGGKQEPARQAPKEQP